MAIFLLDVVVLVALQGPQHVGHSAAHTWFMQEGMGTLVTLDARISTSPIVSPHANLPLTLRIKE